MKLARDKYLLEDEFQALLTAAKMRHHVHAIRDLALLAVGGLGGLRAIEICSLRVGDVARVVERPAIIAVPTAKQRTVVYDDLPIPVHAALILVRYLRTLPDRQPWERLFALTTRQAGRIFKTYAAAARLSPAYSIHALRHYRGVSVYAATHDIMLTMAALRHRDVKSTQVYAHVVDMMEKVGAVDTKLPAGWLET